MQYADDDAIRQRLAAELNRGLTFRQLSKQLGISQPFLSQFMSKQRPHASAVMLKRLGYDLTRYYKRVNNG